MNDGSKNLISTYEFYETPNQILINMYHSNICTAEQIYRTFGYATPASAFTTLKRLKNEGKVISENGDKFKSLGNVFYISNLGCELALTYLGKKSHTLTEDYKQIPNYKLLGDRKYDNLEHAIITVDFYYLLLKLCRYNNFTWYSSGESVIVSKDEKSKAWPDASFICAGTKCLIEQDMGTEDTKQLKTKFTNYAKAFFKSDNMPIILFSINLEYMLTAKQRGKCLASLDKMRMELEKLKDELKPIKNPDTNNKAGTAIIGELKQRYERMVQEYYEKRDEVYDNILSGTYVQTIDKVKGAILNIDDDKSIQDTFYNRLLEGLNIYVNKHSKTHEYITKFAAAGIDTTNIIAELILDDMAVDFIDNPGMKTFKDCKYQLLHAHNSFVIDKYITVTKKSGIFNTYMIFDISCNNVGSYARLIHILRNYKPSDPELELLYIVVVVDDEEQAKDISREALKYGMHPTVNSKVGIRYVNINKVESLLLYDERYYALLEAYGIVDDVVVFPNDNDDDTNEEDTATIAL